MSFLPASLKTIEGKPVTYGVDDIRFIYASLSRVSQTRDKQLDTVNLKDRANVYLGEIKNLSEEQKGKLSEYIDIVS
jgi:hypothetical protein